MRILYLSQYFPPEVGATQTRAYEMAQGLLRAGHQVTILAEVPNHPKGIIRPEYRGKFWAREPLDGIDVIRVWVKTAPTKTFKTRMAFYLSYLFNAVLVGLLLARGRYNVIYATSPPLFVGAAALVLSRLRRIPFVFEVRDLWPESAIALGELHNPRFISWATALEEACYRHARRIVVTTQEIKDQLVRRGYEQNHIVIIRNGANPELFQFNAKIREQKRQELGLSDRFTIIYAGLMGIAQGLESSLEAASQITQIDPSVHFLYIGDGPQKNMLVQRAKDLKLTNVTFLPAQPREDIPGFLNASDAALIPLTRTRLIGALPSKMFDAMACERPVILAAEGEAQRVLQDANAGSIIPPEDPTALVETILHLKMNAETCHLYGKNGRKAVLTSYSRQAQARALVMLLENTI